MKTVQVVAMKNQQPAPSLHIRRWQKYDYTCLPAHL
jgi:hypothetical protein